MYQNYNYYPQNNQLQNGYMRQPQMPQTIGLKGHPVSSLEEARATSIDFDGSVFYFPDLANKRIYTKQINMDGTATLNMYELKEMPPQNTQNNFSSIGTNNYITREEFENAIMQLRNSFNIPNLMTQEIKPKEEIKPF